MKSSYEDKYAKVGSLVRTEKIKPPSDNLKSDGFFFGNTSYKANYINNPGVNQYIKPKPDSQIGGLAFHGKTSYQQNFVGEIKARTESCPKPQDNLRTGAGFIGSSTYRAIYQQPKEKDYVAKVKISEKLQKDIPYKHQYGINLNLIKI